LIYLLDTNVCIRFLTGRNPKVGERINDSPRGDIAICDIVKAELLYGAFKSNRKPANIALLSAFFAQFTSLPFNEAAAYHYSRLRAYLKPAGQPIGPLDLQIAAIALANSLTIVTHNTREFSRVPGLRIDDWEA
jgi:tRNA(fMet)-specific endonuclease VapC